MTNSLRSSQWFRFVLGTLMTLSLVSLWAVVVEAEAELFRRHRHHGRLFRSLKFQVAARKQFRCPIIGYILQTTIAAKPSVCL